MYRVACNILTRSFRRPQTSAKATDSTKFLQLLLKIPVNSWIRIGSWSPPKSNRLLL